MPWNPGATYRGGELLANGLAQAGQSIGEGIKLHKQRTDQLKATRALALAYDLPAEQVDKMDLGTLQGTLQGIIVKQQRAQQAQAAKGRAAVPGFVADVAGGVAGTQPDMAAFMGGQGPRRGQPMNPLQAVIAGLQKNPAVLDTDEGKDALASVVKRMVAPQRPAAMPGVMNGQPGVIQPGGNFTQTRLPPPARPGVAGGGAGRPNAAAGLDPDEELMPYTPQGSKTPIPGLYRKMKGGKSTGYWQDPQAAARMPGTGTPAKAGAAAFADLLQQAGSGGSGLGSGGGGAAVPAVGEERGGYKFKGGDPADQANWEPVGE